jgi:hypothetical protein
MPAIGLKTAIGRNVTTACTKFEPVRLYCFSGSVTTASTAAVTTHRILFVDHHQLTWAAFTLYHFISKEMIIQKLKKVTKNLTFYNY